MINDADFRIHSFWSSIINRTDAFLQLMHDTTLSVEEWRTQRAIYHNSRLHDRLSVGFATFYLNRCNRSGIIANAGIIGGVHQTGRWKLDARFSREELTKRIERIRRYKDRIELSKYDAITFLKKLDAQPTKASRAFVYLDPPYYAKGSQLYLNHYQPSDHASLAAYLSSGPSFKWILSYDNVPEIRRLYRVAFKQVTFNLGYSADNRRVGRELLIYSPKLNFPRKWHTKIADEYITAAAHVAPSMPI